jgi:conjugative transfer signal peptidase TraF
LRAGCFAVITIAAVFATIIAPPRVLLVWNTTASVPVGLYVVSRATPRRGDLFVIQLPPEMETLAVSRAILTPNTPVLKPIAALSGDRVCRWGAAVTINGRLAAIARRFDRRDRTLPIWQGCRLLSASQVFVLALNPESFDSRYYGPLHIQLGRGVAHPLMTLPY